MAHDLVLKNGLIVTPGGAIRGGVAIAGERIVGLGAEETLGGARREIDLQGKIVMPGLFDPHVHFGVADKSDDDGTFPLAADSGSCRIQSIGGDIRSYFWDMEEKGGSESACCSNATRSLASTPCTRRHYGYRAILTTPAILQETMLRAYRFFHQYTPWAGPPPRVVVGDPVLQLQQRLPRRQP